MRPLLHAKQARDDDDRPKEHGHEQRDEAHEETSHHLEK